MATPVGCSNVPEMPQSDCGVALAIERCPRMAITASSLPITASWVIHSYGASGYSGRRPVPSELTIHVRCGALPPVSQQKTISPGIQGLDCTCPIQIGRAHV